MREPTSSTRATTPLFRTCRECGHPFEITVAEQVWLQQLGEQNGTPVYLPARCTPCRSALRAARYAVQPDRPDEWRRCVECGVDFVFGGRDRDYFASRGWLPPNRCRECRRRGSR